MNMYQTTDTPSNLPTNDKPPSVQDDSYRTILFYFKLCLLIFGFFGNIFCIVIWVKKEFIKMPRSICCIILSIVDTSSLILHFSAVAYDYFERKMLYFISEFVCRFMLFWGWFYATHGFMDYSDTYHRTINIRFVAMFIACISVGTDQNSRLWGWCFWSVRPVKRLIPPL